MKDITYKLNDRITIHFTFEEYKIIKDRIIYDNEIRNRFAEIEGRTLESIEETEKIYFEEEYWFSS